MALSWGNYPGFGYKLWSRTNLLNGSWSLEASGVTENTYPVPLSEHSEFFKVEMELETEEP